MTDNLNHRKYQLIQEIIRIQNEGLIEALEREIVASREHRNMLWASLIKPTKPKLSLADMISEQSYTPITKDDFFAAADTVGIEEPIEDLLKMLD